MTETFPKVIGFDAEMLRKTTCERCTAIIQYAPINIKTFKRVYASGAYEIFDVVDCPNCGDQVEV